MITDIALEPLTGTFDVPAIETFLTSRAWAAPDPIAPHTFILGYARDVLDEALAERTGGATGFPGPIVVVAVHPQVITLGYSTSRTEEPRRFVQWLRERYALKVLDNDYGRDRTEHVDDKLELLFGKVHPPVVSSFDENGLELINDPDDIAHELVLALLSGRGAELQQPPVAAGQAPLQIARGLVASWDGMGWRIRSDDRGELTLSPETIERLAGDASQLREAFLRDHLPLGATLDDGRYELREELAGGADRGLYRGRDRERQTSVLISIGTPQRDPLDQVRQRLGYELPGIAALRHIGPVTAIGEARYDGLVEDEPAGIPSADHPTVMGAATTARLGLAVAEVVAAAHARGIVLGGLRPELVYIDGDRVTGIAPRCDVFHAKMTKPDYGVPLCFPHVYFAPEVLARPEDPPTPAADVFALAAMIAYWHTGEHPFTGDYSANVIAIMSRQRTPWRGDAKLGAIVESGLLPLPGRTTLDRLVAMLSETFALGTS